LLPLPVVPKLTPPDSFDTLLSLGSSSPKFFNSSDPFGLLSTILFYSFSLSGDTDGGYVVSAHPSCTKRVNPSSGGLHPEEVYVIHSQLKKTFLSHYLPKHHSLGNTFRILFM
jgi:hypothetical protein